MFILGVIGFGAIHIESSYCSSVSHFMCCVKFKCMLIVIRIDTTASTAHLEVFDCQMFITVLVLAVCSVLQYVCYCFVYILYSVCIYCPHLIFAVSSILLLYALNVFVIHCHCWRMPANFCNTNEDYCSNALYQ